MPNALNLSADALIFHNSEAVVFHKRGYASGAATDTTTNVANALRRSLTQKDLLQVQLEVTVASCVFHLPVSQIGSVEPTNGDYIAAADANWTVKLAAKQAFNTRWRCICTRQVL
jgi:hypothetical protein